ncbi:MAG: hypothetical protein ACM359_20850 [Bacillota bacterium]
MALLAVWIALLACGGCAGLSGPSKKSPEEMGAAQGQKTILPAELDELTRAFADRYVGLLSSTCDALKKDNPNAAQRREAQQLLLNCATNVYDIASNADAFTRMLDLVVVTTLVSQVWIDDNRAGEVFPDRAEVLVRALHHGRVEAWALAAQVLRPDQLDLLDYLIWDWRRHNPDMTRAAFVRFSNFAVGRGRSADAEVLAAGGFFAGIGQVGKAVDEARLLTERIFYLSKRAPTLLGWTAEAMKEDIFAAPDVGKALADMHRVTDQIEQLPAHVAAERQAILAALDKRLKGADATLGNLRAALTEAIRTSDSLKEMLKTADPLFARFDAWDRWSVSLPGHRSFDIREYTEGVKELAVAVGKVNDLLKSSNNLLASPEWDRRMEQVNQSADARIKVAAEQSQLLMDDFFRRLYVALGGFFAMLILYRVVTLLLMRRSRAVEGRKGTAP